ncbi:hypothetical protein B0H11DRAFT_2239832 [Mycena galericulata]|nr:hypothetical protein B0H11DRAFT_2239832 [Mycena galericulata]
MPALSFGPDSEFLPPSSSAHTTTTPPSLSLHLHAQTFDHTQMNLPALNHTFLREQSEEREARSGSHSRETTSAAYRASGAPRLTRSSNLALLVPVGVLGLRLRFCLQPALQYLHPESEEDEVRRPGGLGREASLYDREQGAFEFALAERHVAPWTRVLATTHANSNGVGPHMRAISSPASTLLHPLLWLPLLPDSSSVNGSLIGDGSTLGSANRSSRPPTPIPTPALWRAVLQHAGVSEAACEGARGHCGCMALWIVRAESDVCGMATVGVGWGRAQRSASPRLCSLAIYPSSALQPDAPTPVGSSPDPQGAGGECIAAALPYTPPPTTPTVTADCTSTPKPTKKEGAQVDLAPTHPRVTPYAEPAARRRRPPTGPPIALEDTLPRGHGVAHPAQAAARIPRARDRQGGAHQCGGGGEPSARRVCALAAGVLKGGGGQQQSAKGVGSPHPLHVLRITVPRPLYEGGAAAAGPSGVRWVVAQGVRAPAATPCTDPLRSRPIRARAHHGRRPSFSRPCHRRWALSASSSLFPLPSILALSALTDLRTPPAIAITPLATISVAVSHPRVALSVALAIYLISSFLCRFFLY